jgi:hypothetical protein
MLNKATKRPSQPDASWRKSWHPSRLGPTRLGPKRFGAKSAFLTPSRPLGEAVMDSGFSGKSGRLNRRRDDGLSGQRLVETSIAIPMDIDGGVEYADLVKHVGDILWLAMAPSVVATSLRSWLSHRT